MSRLLMRCGVAVVLVLGTTVAIAAPASAAAPGVSTWTPTSGSAAGGTRVTLRGHDFNQVQRVRFNSGPGTSLHIVSSTTLLVSTPAHPAGKVGIWFDTAGGAINTGATFTYTGTVPPNPVGYLSGAAGVGTVALSWTNPSNSDLAGVRICRTSGDVAPSPHCTTGWSLAKPAHTYHDSGLPAGPVHYWVWAYNTSRQYSAVAPAGVTVKGNGTPGAVVAANSSQATADVLPTVQIDGVAWTQAVVYDTVYVGGLFGHARPAGAAAGTSQTTRDNLLAYSLSTGQLINSWNPKANGQVLAMSVSPDRKRLYIGGNFTVVSGQRHPYIAAFDLTTGKVIPSFAPNVNSTIRAVTASNTAVYAGGDFTSVNGTKRQHLAAFNTAGGLTGWAPYTDNDVVRSILLTPDGSKVVIGGTFTYLNGTVVKGLSAVSSSSGVRQTWRTSEVLSSYGHSSAADSAGGVISLRTDGNLIYGADFNFHNAPGGFDGIFAMSPFDGTVQWITGCHGDNYDTYLVSNTVYSVGHPHWCANMNGWVNPQKTELFTRRAMAFTSTATGTLSGATETGVAGKMGEPAPSIVDWFPTLSAGSATGQDQAAWNISGHGQYVALAGEFPTVNGIGQQGLVRFATRPTAPAKVGSEINSTPFAPTATSNGTGGVTVSAPAPWDEDSLVLSYSLIRDGDKTHPVATTTSPSTFWNRPTVSMTDPSAGVGQTHTYTMIAVDSDGNSRTSSPVTITVT